MILARARNPGDEDRDEARASSTPAPGPGRLVVVLRGLDGRRGGRMPDRRVIDEVANVDMTSIGMWINQDSGRHVRVLFRPAARYPRYVLYTPDDDREWYLASVTSRERGSHELERELGSNVPGDAGHGWEYMVMGGGRSTPEIELHREDHGKSVAVLVARLVGGTEGGTWIPASSSVTPVHMHSVVIRPKGSIHNPGDEDRDEARASSTPGDSARLTAEKALRAVTQWEADGGLPSRLGIERALSAFEACPLQIPDSWIVRGMIERWLAAHKREAWGDFTSIVHEDRDVADAALRSRVIAIEDLEKRLNVLVPMPKLNPGDEDRDEARASAEPQPQPPFLDVEILRETGGSGATSASYFVARDLVVTADEARATPAYGGKTRVFSALDFGSRPGAIAALVVRAETHGDEVGAASGHWEYFTTRVAEVSLKPASGRVASRLVVADRTRGDPVIEADVVSAGSGQATTITARRHWTANPGDEDRDEARASSGESRNVLNVQVWSVGPPRSPSPRTASNFTAFGLTVTADEVRVTLVWPADERTVRVFHASDFSVGPGSIAALTVQPADNGHEIAGVSGDFELLTGRVFEVRTWAGKFVVVDAQRGSTVEAGLALVPVVLTARSLRTANPGDEDRDEARTSAVRGSRVELAFMRGGVEAARLNVEQVRVTTPTTPAYNRRGNVFTGSITVVREGEVETFAVLTDTGRIVVQAPDFGSVPDFDGLRVTADHGMLEAHAHRGFHFVHRGGWFDLAMDRCGRSRERRWRWAERWRSDDPGVAEPFAVGTPGGRWSFDGGRTNDLQIDPASSSNPGDEDRDEARASAGRDVSRCDSCGEETDEENLVDGECASCRIGPAERTPEERLADARGANRFRSGWSHESGAPKCEAACPRCGNAGNVHHEAGEHYCAECDDYTAGHRLEGCSGFEPEPEEEVEENPGDEDRDEARASRAAGPSAREATQAAYEDVRSLWEAGLTPSVGDIERFLAVFAEEAPADHVPADVAHDIYGSLVDWLSEHYATTLSDLVALVAGSGFESSDAARVKHARVAAAQARLRAISWAFVPRGPRPPYVSSNPGDEDRDEARASSVPSRIVVYVPRRWAGRLGRKAGSATDPAEDFLVEAERFSVVPVGQLSELGWAAASLVHGALEVYVVIRVGIGLLHEHDEPDWEGEVVGEGGLVDGAVVRLDASWGTDGERRGQTLDVVLRLVDT